ncbi:tudor domain-containing protein [Aphelenchoides avenae]|nr:tudor domain-containing protein [Aphelenchus avenae]
MVAICRDPSPMTNEPKRKEVKKMVLDPNKIHRIIIQSETLVTVSNVESPSRIWVKLRNHITDQLRYRKGHKLEKLEGLPSVMDYVMAPLKVRSQTANTDELIYARARVLKSNYELSVWLVHYIDEGVQQWLSRECLAKMEPAFFTHPWQAIPVCLFRARPDGEQWKDEHVTILRDVLGQYDLLRVQPMLCKPQNNYAFYSRVLLYGVPNGSDPLKRGQCILREFYLRTMLRWPGTAESHHNNKK